MTIHSYTPSDPFGGTKIGTPRTVRSRSHKDSFGPTPTDDEMVPDGPIDAIVAWVGHDVDRAKAALVAERSRGQSAQRKTLIASLEGRITG